MLSRTFAGTARFLLELNHFLDFSEAVSLVVGDSLRVGQNNIVFGVEMLQLNEADEWWLHADREETIYKVTGELGVGRGDDNEILLLDDHVSRRHATSHRERTLLYRAMELVGKWSMTDVFVVAILVGLIQLGGLLRITAGSAAIAFGGVVIVTMLAAESFDPRLIWDQLGDADE